MGSGGPRGLQIPRSGVESVRGGFDSHAFPPHRARPCAPLAFALLVAVVSGLAGTAAGAQAPAPPARDSSATRADTLGAVRAGPRPDAFGAAPGAATPVPSDSGAAPAPLAAPEDTAARGLRLERARSVVRDTARWRPHRGRFDAPRWVMLRSLAVPGWGQLHNGSWLKALLLGGGEVWLVAGMVEDGRKLDDLQRLADAALAARDEPAHEVAVNAYNDRLNRFVSRQWFLGGLLAYSLMDAYVDAHFRDFKVEFQHDPALPNGVPGGTRLFLRWDF
jgi:hypothetical protein